MYQSMMIHLIYWSIFIMPWYFLGKKEVSNDHCNDDPCTGRKEGKKHLASNMMLMQWRSCLHHISHVLVFPMERKLLTMPYIAGDIFFLLFVILVIEFQTSICQASTLSLKLFPTLNFLCPICLLCRTLCWKLRWKFVLIYCLVC